MTYDSRLDISLNQRLIDLVQKWKKSGSQQQEGFNWVSSKKNWENAFNSEISFISSLPSEIDRQIVRSICESSSYSMRQKFLAVMVWGYGDRGYGPYRVTQMLEQTDALRILSEVEALCRAGEPKTAYAYLKENRIQILGPSYSSKVLTFFTPREVGAPIYDSLIALWVERFAKNDFVNVPTTAERWNSKTYFRYWDWIKDHALALNCYPDELELVIFRDAESKFAKSSSWNGK